MKEDEYKELFLAEAHENFSEVNRLLTMLEKNSSDKNTINSIFRITHTLKGNARGMGFDKIADVAHVLEDFFGEVRDGRITITTEIFGTVFKATDILGELIESIRTPKDVKYRGIKTKLEVLISQSKNKNTEVSTEVAQDETPQNQSDAHQEAGDEPVAESESDSTKVTFSDLVQVPVRKLDNLLNLVSELVIERDRLITVVGKHSGNNEFARLNRISSDLQYSVMDVRLVQVGFLFNKFHRIVRDAASVENKNVQLKLEGTETEIDRNILQVISDSLIHLIRNCVGHGIESPAQRKEAGKPETGTVVLKASSDTSNVLIEIIDDGAGIDSEKVRRKAVERKLITPEEAAQLSERDSIMLIFQPGFSTVDQVTAISGRGVGMDVVKRALDSIGGSIDVNTMPGQGTRILLNLPSSMAVKSTLLFELGRETYAIPLSYTESVVSIYKTGIHRAGGGLVTVNQERTIPVVFLNDLFDSDEGNIVLDRTYNDLHPETQLQVIVVSINGRRFGLVADKLLQQKEIVEKPLRKPVDMVKIVSGTTILGNGSVCMVLNIPSLVSAYTNLIGAKLKANKTN